MFDGFAHVWTPVVRASRVGRAPLPVVVAGEPLVLFRSAGGELAALVDRCPHRGARLSLGTVTSRGHLACPFHGWELDGAGANRHVPFNPEAKLAHLGAVAIPVRRIGELVWIHTAPLGEAPLPPPLFPDALAGERDRRVYLERTWECHWTRAMENMLDSPHLPFVHRTTIGRPLRRRMTRSSRMELLWEELPWGGRQRVLLDGRGDLATLEFYKPNMMALEIPAPGKRFRVHALVVPVDAARTRLILVGSRDFALWRVLDPVFNLTNAVIARQDRSIVESSSPAEVPPAADEASVATDRVTLQFRRYYLQELKASRARDR